MTPGTGVRGRIIAAVTARVLLNELRSELAPVEAAIRGHRYLDLFAAALPRSLERFTGEQYAILTSDRRSFAQLAVRFPAGGAGELFLVLAEGEGQALERLLPLAEQLGLDQDRLRGVRARARRSGLPVLRRLVGAERIAGRRRARLPGQPGRLGRQLRANGGRAAWRP
jgi:hypothetical protein